MKKIIISFLLVSSLSFSVMMSPLIETIDNLKKRHLVFNVSNPTDKMVAATFKVKLLVDTNGKKEVREDTKKVIAFPSQFVLKPKESKKIRVRYLGSSIPDIEEVYRVIAHELDVKIEDETNKKTSKKNGKVTMRFTYEGLLFVHKPNASEKLSIERIEVLDNHSLKLLVKNNGNASIVPNQNFYNFTIVTKNGKEYKIPSNSLKNSIFKRVLAGKETTLILKDINLPKDKIATIRLEKKSSI